MIGPAPYYMEWIDTSDGRWVLKPGAPEHVVKDFEKDALETSEYWKQFSDQGTKQQDDAEFREFLRTIDE